MSSDLRLQDYVYEIARLAKTAARELATLPTDTKNAALLAMADSLWEHRDMILQANELDIVDARNAGQSEGRIDRLQITEKRITDMMEGLQQVVNLQDPIGDSLETILRQDGLEIEKVRVPLGVIVMIYESRPNVTVDAAGLAIKTGNAVILRGGKEALRTNQELVNAIRHGLEKAQVPADAIQFINRTERESIDLLIQARGLVDLVIPRGGAGLIQRVVQHASVPVIETGVGNCHIYVDRSADQKKASAIVINAKTQRPSVCNAAETLLIHADIAESWLPTIAKKLFKKGVEIRGCERTLQILERECPPQDLNQSDPERYMKLATEEDWAEEFLDLILAVKIVDSYRDAVNHIHKYSTMHSEAIITEDIDTANQFLQEVDAAAVYHNASTRFTDGFEFGFGAEIGISTQKLHARGPMGLKELTSYKYVIRGNGQIRG